MTTRTLTTMRVLVYEPGQPGELRELPGWRHVDEQLAAMQAVVGGYIETVFLRGGLLLVVNEEGKLIGLPFNRTLVLAGGVREDLVGTFFVARVAGADFVSLTPADVEFVRAMFG